MPKVTWKGGALLAPVPAAMVTCSHAGRDNVLTIAWTGIINSQPPKTYISVRPGRFSYEMIKESKEFVINLPSRAMVRAADYCGIKSGRDVDKFSEMSLKTEPSPTLGCPMLCDCPVSIECRVFEVKPLGSHEMFMADILSVSVDDRFIDEGGKFRLDKADVVGFAHGSYYTLGSFLGNMGYSVMKKKTAKRKRKR